jgi:hypothetical protein
VKSHRVHAVVHTGDVRKVLLDASHVAPGCCQQSRRCCMRFTAVFLLCACRWLPVSCGASICHSHDGYGLEACAHHDADAELLSAQRLPMAILYNQLLQSDVISFAIAKSTPATYQRGTGRRAIAASG